MLIYNSQKEFLGIDQKDLSVLGFNDLAGLKAEVSDFADLFVKTPGYIHNFKHVHWIDFITCADSHEESKVIINVGGKSFKAIVTIQPAYLSDNSTSKAFIVYLNNLRELTNNENEKISGDIAEKPTSNVTPSFVSPEVHDVFEESAEVVPVTVQEDPYETPIDVHFDDEDDTIEEELKEVNEISKEDVAIVPDDMDAMLDVGDLSFDDEESLVEQEHSVEEELKTTKTELVHENFDNGYVYDPHVASDELGLPLDLIEEFIQDFIQQAKEFKEELYTSLDNAELDNVKILSHKLKGVSANLRVEDAFETLSIINTAEDVNVIKENLDLFYKIIAKLAGEEIVVEKTVEVPVKQEKIPEFAPEEEKLELVEEDDDDLYSIEDEEVPEKIDIAELADDEFVSTDDELSLVEEEADTIEEDLETIEDIANLDIDTANIPEADLLDIDLELEDDFSEIENELSTQDEVTIAPEEVVEVEYLKDSVANEIGLDKESFEELLQDYLQEAKTCVNTIQEAIAQDDYQLSTHEAIKLKGMSDNMRVQDVLPELETIAHSSNKQEIATAIEKIEAVLAQISNIRD